MIDRSTEVSEMKATSLRFVIAVSNVDFQCHVMLFTSTDHRNEHLIVISSSVNCFDSEHVQYFITGE